MVTTGAKLAGVELYFEDLETAKRFYRDVLGLPIAEEAPGHFAKFAAGAGFVCLERKGSEAYPSRDKAVLFFEVLDLEAKIAGIGRQRIVQSQPAGGGRPAWAVLHDPEGHNILLLEARSGGS